jgi:hypothetical protein
MPSPGVPPMPERPLDPRVAMVSVQVVMLEVALEAAPKPGAERQPAAVSEPAKANIALGAIDLSASNEKILEEAGKLGIRGRLEVIYRVQLATVDQQKAMVQFGQREAEISGVSVNQFGQMNSVTYVNTGLMLEIEPKVDPSGVVSMAVNLQDSRFGRVDEGTPLSISAKGETIRARPICNVTMKTVVNAPSGQTIALGGLVAEDGPRKRQLVVLIAPRIVAPSPDEANRPRPVPVLPRPDPRFSPPSPTVPSRPSP